MAAYLTLQIKGADELISRFSSAPRRLRDGLGAALRAATAAVRREMRARAPVFRGVLRARGVRMRSLSAAGLLVGAVVRPAAPHAHLVERGRRPGRMPPTTASGFASFAERIGARPFPLARAIALRGTRPRPFWEASVRAAQPRIEQLITEAVRSLEEVLR